MPTQAMIEGAGAVDAGAASGVFGPAPLTPEALIAAEPEVIVLPEGATVGAVGVVVFVGLLIPLLARPMMGPRHRNLLFGSVILGGAFLVGSDVVARAALEPIEIPVGLVTPVFGGPMFLWLATRQRDD